MRWLFAFLLLCTPLLGQVDSVTAPVTENISIPTSNAFYWVGQSSGGSSDPVPQNLQIVQQGPESVLLTWDPPVDTNGVVGYEIYRDTVSPVAVIGATHMSSASLENRYAWDVNSTLQDWYYTVVAVKNDGTVSSAATEVQSTTAHENGILGPIRGEYPRIAQSDVFFWPGQIPDTQRPERKDFVDHWGNHNDVVAGDDWNLTWVPYYDVSEPEVLYENILANGTFDNATGWTLGTGWTISGGTLNIDGTNGTTASYTLASALTDWLGATVRVKYDITSYTSGSGRNNIGGQNGAAETTVATHYDYYHFNVSGSDLDIEFESNGSWNCSIDNVEVDIINIGYGDSWFRPGLTSSSARIIDSTEIDWNTGSLAASDWAWETRISTHDNSSGSIQYIWTQSQSGDRAFEIYFSGTGQLVISCSDDGTTNYTRTFGQLNSWAETGNWPRDGFDCPVYLRVEFDYDDGAGDSQIRIGVSGSRNRGEGWIYQAWQTLWTSNEVFDPIAPIYIGSRADGARSGNGTQMWGWELFGDLDESNTTPLYSSYPWEHNHGGDADIAINVANNQFPSSLVTRPHTAWWEFDNATLANDATYTPAEGNTWFTFAAVNEFANNQDRAFNRVNGGAEFGHFSNGSAQGFARADDGTTDVSTTAIAFDNHVPEVYSISVDRTNDLLWYSQSGVTPVSADISSVTNIDTAVGTGSMSILRRSMSWYGAGRIPSAFIDSTTDANNVLSSINFELPGRRGINDVHRANLVGSGPTPWPGTVDKMAYDTYIITFNNYTGWASKGIQEIELFTTPDLTGTPVSRNTDIDQDTRAQFPAAMSHFFDHTDVNAVSNEWEWNEMIDGNALTVYTPPSTASGHATAAGSTQLYVYLNTPQRVRSFRILYDAVTDTAATTQVRLYGWNRNGTGEPIQIFREDVSNGAATYNFQNILMSDLNALNIHRHPDLDI